MTQTSTNSIICKLLFASALLLLVGCQRETFEWMDDNRPNPDGSMRFSLKTEDADKETDQLQTRGTPRNSLEEYHTVSVDVFSHTSDYTTTGGDVEFLRKVLLEQKEAKWNYTPSLFWPTEKKLSFIAYASDIPFKEAGITFVTSPSAEAPERINYQVPDNVTKQPDLLVSTKFNQTKVNNVTLTMKHALACVSFCGIAPEGETTYVKSITLRNVCSKGTLTLNDPLMKWTTDTNSKGVTVFEPGIKDDQELGKDPLQDNNYLMTEDGYLMMIPQKLEDAAIDVLYWNGKDETENKVITYTLPVDNESYATWKPGLKYIYKFGNQSPDDITVVYYEKYADGYGLYYNSNGKPINTIRENGMILEAGYGVLSKEAVGQNQAPIRLTTPSSPPVSSSTVVELKDIGFLYPVDQSGSETFTLPISSIPVDVYFNNDTKSCGMIVPHFARGVYTVKTEMTPHAIRTPQQMRNITVLGRSSARKKHTYTQELDLDFSKTSIGGGELSTSVVACDFNDVYNGQKKRIENVKINATKANGALFYSNSGEIKEICLLNSSISSSGNTGGIAATNEATGEIIHPRIIGEFNTEEKMFKVQGSLYTGAIAGLNHGTITGNNIDLEVATELPLAEVSGWVSIKGVSQPVGGITGQNQGTITTCLVNGVHVTGPNWGDVEIAKITIEGGSYVGGIVGVNKNMVIGNNSTNGAEPDVAGLVSITGSNDFVGGIAGENSGTLNQVNIRLGRGKDATEATTITGKRSVGGIVGINNGGTLKADGSSFISVRGNIIITGTEHVGGVVGNNSSGSISNCFVYNFYNQKGTVHYAPKITGEKNVGGIVGYSGSGTIKQCAIFSTVSITNSGGDDVTNAIAEVKATASSAGGIVGHGFTKLNITQSFVLGNVKINGELNSGGIVGENEEETTITSVHVGNSGAAVSDIYNRLFTTVKLPVYDKRMKTEEGVMKETSGTPTIVGTTYVGGICGVNWGTVKEIEIMDNVHIGTETSTYVGGIAGGNGQNATIQNCKTYNPKGSAAIVSINGFEHVGGIVGLNNGIVSTCQLGLPGLDQSRLITIQGASSLGGIAGSNGGHELYPYGTEIGTGNDETRITNCNVYGKVLIEAIFGAVDKGFQYRAGGILGQNGPTNRVIDCNVIGNTSDSNSQTYDITVRGVGDIGGIAGMNYGIIRGSSSASNNKVTHTAVIASNGYAGGLAGAIKSNKANSFEAQLYDCDVSNGVYVSAWGTHAGAFAGQLDGADATETNHTLFGTGTPGEPTNRVCTKASNPVRVNGNPVKIAPPIGDFTFSVNPGELTNLWAKFQLWNYLYYTEY